jgi:hypothetical protein
MFGNIADKRAACSEAARMLRPGGASRGQPSRGSGVCRTAASRDGSVHRAAALRGQNSSEWLLCLVSEGIRYQDEPKLYLLVARKAN